MQQVSGSSEIGDVQLHTHHYKYSATCLTGEQKAGSKAAKTNETVQCGCFDFFLVIFSVYLPKFYTRYAYAYLRVREY